MSKVPIEVEYCEEVKKWPVVHFFYLSALFIIVIAFVITLAFGQSTRAGESLTFGATLVSIILAVIAILYTLFDSSSQKRNSDQIRKSVKNLGGFSHDLKQSTDDIKEQISEMKSFNTELLSKLVVLDKWQKQLEVEIKEKMSNVSTVEESKKIIEESFSRQPSINSAVAATVEIRNLENTIIDHMHHFADIGSWSYTELFKGLLKGDGLRRINSNMFIQALENLVNDGKLTMSNKRSENPSYSLRR